MSKISDAIAIRIGHLTVAVEQERLSMRETLALLRRLKANEITLDEIEITPSGWEIKPTASGE